MGKYLGFTIQSQLKGALTMLIDFHTHCKLAKKLPFSTEYTDWLFRQANSSGLDTLCLTEHFNTLQFEEIYAYISSICRQDGDSLLLSEGLRLFPGMETDIAEGGHILTIGSMETILELNGILTPYKQKEHFLPFNQLMDLFDRYPVLVGAAHPFREGSNIPGLPFEQLTRLKFLDLNGKDVAINRQRTEQLTYAFGEKLKKPVVGGSDTHQAVQFGCIHTNFLNTCTTIQELHQEMNAGHYEIHIQPEAAFQVKTAGLLKRALKEIHALGGDYISLLTQSMDVS
jgi:hypothetical protein